MKAKWKNDEIKSLFDMVEKNQKQNLPIMQSFKEFGKISNRNPLSVRNFYYAQARLLQNNNKLRHELGIDLTKHKIQQFEHFDEVDENEMRKKIEQLKEKGYSTRKACFELSNGDIKQMLRIQNKYRNIQQKLKIDQATVIQFPKKDNAHSAKLSDDDIKSLFMGLVKLVKENANSETQENAQRFLEETERQNRKKMIEIEQLKNEISLLREQIAELKVKNKNLNSQLENYRIDFVLNSTHTDGTV